MFARRSADTRALELCFASPEYAFATSRRNRFIRATNVRSARLMKFGPRRRVLELHLHDGERLRLTLDDHLQSSSLALETLRVPLGSRLRVERHRVRVSAVVMGALIGVTAVLSTALLFYRLAA